MNNEHGTKAVRNCDGGPPLCCRIQSGLDDAFRLGIQSFIATLVSPGTTAHKEN